MLRIAICDDEIKYVDIIDELIEKFNNNSNQKFETFRFTDAKELMNSDCTIYDIIFLDVEINENFGIDVAKSIKNINENIVVVYVSSYVQYAPYGYRVKAFAYLLKESLENSFDDTMRDILNEINFKNRVYKFIYNKNEVSVPLKEILFFESFDKTVYLHTKDKSYCFRGKISDVEKELLYCGFLKIHKSYLVNMDHIVYMKNYIIKLTNEKELNVSQKRWKEVAKIYVGWKSKI